MSPAPASSRSTTASAQARGLPCVVQVGFAGSRRLSGEAVQEYLEKALVDLPQQLGLSEWHFLAGISQVAIGADTVFTRACRKLGIPQRIFLPQHREAYLAAVGSKGDADFTPDERAEAGNLLASDHIIEERVVSDSADRSARFEDTNLEILRASDVVVCLLPADGIPGRAGGTDDLLERSKRRGKVVLVIRVSMADGEVGCSSEWHHREAFSPPRLPGDLAKVVAGHIEDSREYCRVLKDATSRLAAKRRKLFEWSARAIIGAHIFATLCATVALAFHPAGIAWLLGTELALLATAWTLHWHLHRSHAAKQWAFNRLIAEITRSLRPIPEVHLHLDHLLALPLPELIHPLLRTLNVMHLKSTRSCRGGDWRAKRDVYIRDRLTKPGGQMKYYSDKSDAANRDLWWTRLAFMGFTGLAIAATLVKLLGKLNWLPVPIHWDEVLGTLAIILPVFAVGALSWAAAMDLEARAQTFAEMSGFLKKLKSELEEASSEAEFHKMLREAESRMLGETATWFSRRSYTLVT